VKIISNEVIAAKAAGSLFEFLCDFNNYRLLMPEQVVKWESTARAGRFTIRDTAEIGMKIIETVPDKRVVLSSDGKVPFDFELWIELESLDDAATKVLVGFEGQIQPFIAMMAKRPLTNLVNHMAESIRDLP
jgi:carbon monoxide dehydrogenase subunit G